MSRKNTDHPESFQFPASFITNVEPFAATRHVEPLREVVAHESGNQSRPTIVHLRVHEPEIASADAILQFTSKNYLWATA